MLEGTDQRDQLSCIASSRVDGKPPVTARHVNGPEKGPKHDGTEKLFQNLNAARVTLFHLLLLLSVGPDTYLAIGTFFTVNTPIVHVLEDLGKELQIFSSFCRFCGTSFKLMATEMSRL